MRFPATQLTYGCKPIKIVLGGVTTDFFQARWDDSTEAPEGNCQCNPLQSMSKDGPRGKIKLPDKFKGTKWEFYFNEIFGNYEKTISKTTACTLGRKNVDTCQGDSGGPLVTRTKKVKNQSQSRILSSFHIILGYCA